MKPNGYVTELSNWSTKGGQGSPLYKRHHVYVHPVTVTTPPDSYDERLR